MKNIDKEIYIKNGPEIFRVSKSEMKKLCNMQENLQRFSGSIKDSLESSLIAIADSDGGSDYSGIENFWKSRTLGNITTLSCIEFIGESSFKKRFTNKKDLLTYFTPLSEFLNDAEYVGRYFVRINPTSDGCTSYLLDDFFMMDECPMVIYRNENHVLIYQEDCLGKRFSMLDPRYFEDGNLRFIGSQYNTFRDRNLVRTRIENQTNSDLKRGEK